MIELKVHPIGVRHLRETTGIFPKLGLEPRFLGAMSPELWPRFGMQLVGA
jgi:hypothetical protein